MTVGKTDANVLAEKINLIKEEQMTEQKSEYQSIQLLKRYPIQALVCISGSKDKIDDTGTLQRLTQVHSSENLLADRK